MSVRAATAADVAVIRAVEVAAFGRLDEADLVEALRASGAVLAELVFEEDGEIGGHILFSALKTTPSKRVAALAPVAVTPEAQRTGIGSTLCRAGITRCRELAMDAVLVLGDPNYYRRFGFSAKAAKAVESVYSHMPAFMALALKPDALGRRLSVEYPAAFG